MTISPDGPVYIEIGHSKPVAKKDYQCQACLTMMVKGTKHNKFVYKDEDGKIITSRFYLMCP